MTTFEKILLESIEKNLTKIIGKPGQKAIFNFIKEQYSIDRKDIPHRLEALVNGFNTILGTGSKAILNIVVKEVQSTLGLESIKNVNLDFVDQILTLKQLALMRNTRSNEKNPISK